MCYFKFKTCIHLRHPFKNIFRTFVDLSSQLERKLAEIQRLSLNNFLKNTLVFMNTGAWRIENNSYGSKSERARITRKWSLKNILFFCFVFIFNFRLRKIRPCMLSSIRTHVHAPINYKLDACFCLQFFIFFCRSLDIWNHINILSQLSRIFFEPFIIFKDRSPSKNIYFEGVILWHMISSASLFISIRL